MYLSRLVLDPRSRAVQRDLADSQALHRTVLGAFPDRQGASPREAAGVLFRVDSQARGGRLTLLVQSAAAPSWQHLPPGYLAPESGGLPNPAVKAIGGLLERLPSGTRLAFRLRANPTRKIDTRSGPDGERRNGKRVELRGEAAQIAWLQRKAEVGGFRLLRVRASGEGAVAVAARPQPRQVGWRPDAREGTGSGARRLTHAAVIFDGHLEVLDAERFLDTVRGGVGSAKAYGFGLLSVAPVELDHA